MLPYYQFTTYHIGPVVLQVWGTFVALGFGAALWLGFREAPKRRLDTDYFLSLSLWMVVFALIGARLFYVLLFWGDYQGNLLQVLEVWNGGMVAYGGIIGALVALYVFLRRHKLPILEYLDLVALVFPAGYAIGRIGCHLIRDHMGKLTNMPWGFVIAPGEVRHDTALYSILGGIVLFAIFWFNRKRFRTPGVIALATAGLYALERMIIDNFRATDITGSDPRFYGFTLSQYISALTVLFCAVTLFYLLRHKSSPEIREKPLD